MCKSIEKLYGEASNSVRHYSGLIVTLKSVTIAQGCALLAAQGYLYKSKDILLSLGLGLFGIFFTLALYFIGRNLMDHFDAIIKVALKIEETFYPDNQSLCPWTAFDVTSTRENGNKIVMALTLHGHIVMLLVAFLAIILFDILILFR
jgi:hypothetical protein